MAHIKNLYPNTEVYGIEKIPEVVRFASRMGTVVCGDVEESPSEMECAIIDTLASLMEKPTRNSFLAY